MIWMMLNQIQMSDIMSGKSHDWLRLPTAVINPIVDQTIEATTRCPQCEGLLKFSPSEVPNHICPVAGTSDTAVGATVANDTPGDATGGSAGGVCTDNNSDMRQPSAATTSGVVDTNQTETITIDRGDA